MHYTSEVVVMQWKMEDMDELDLASTLKNIILKLPYKLRERWRLVACELQEQHHGRRARLLDLTLFIEKQVRIATHPVFGDIQDPTGSRGNNQRPQSSFSHVYSQIHRISFATSVSCSQKTPKPNTNPTAPEQAVNPLFLGRH
jgi:hypothetical protein